MNPETPPIQHFGDMPTEEFRQHGHALVDWIAAHRQNLDNIKVLPDVQPGSVTEQLPKSAPEAPEAMAAPKRKGRKSVNRERFEFIAFYWELL